MSKSKLRYLFPFIMAVAFLVAIPLHSQAATKSKHNAAQQIEKERLVLMPLRIPEEDKDLAGSMETALVKGLKQRYEVFSGEQVSQKAHQIFMKESQNTAHKECDETRCMQNIAEAFQAELIATANVTKKEGSYFLALSIQNIFDNKVVQSESLTCEKCTAVQVVDKLKELSGTIATAAAAPTPEAPQPKINLSDSETSLWNEVKTTNTIDDYQTYLAQYPKGKYVALANSRIKKLQYEAAAELAKQEQEAWEAADKSGGVDGYQGYLKSFPNGKYAGLAQERIHKLQTDLAARQEQELWQKADASNNTQNILAYLDRYPSGRFAEQAQLKLTAVKQREADRARQEMARITEQERQEREAAALQWANSDNGADINGNDAEQYCASKGSGWRLPTWAELRSSYKSGHSTPCGRLKCNISSNSRLTGHWLWTKEQDGSSEARGFCVGEDRLNSGDCAIISSERVLCVKREAQEQAAAAERQRREAGNGPAMIRIPGKNYEMGKFDVTQKEWRDIMGSSPSHFSSCGDTCPVESVSWNDVHEFIQKLNAKTGKQYRLPIEEEWEYACYGGNKTEYCGSNDIDSVAWYHDNSNSTTHPVGQKQANGYGLYDMSGNVWQWMENLYDGSHPDYGRAQRGGPWGGNTNFLRATSRTTIDPDNRFFAYGFRLARTLP
jgi:formylglycine-generating enzyme required for sulfatase activity